MRFRMARLMVLSACRSSGAGDRGAIGGAGLHGAHRRVMADSTGAVLPGVTVDISGPQNALGGHRRTGRSALPEPRARNVHVGAKLAGFSDYLNKSIDVATGASVPLKIALAVGGVATQVQVTAETPVIDTKKMGTSTNVSVEELQNIPSSRDPWVVLQTVPGIIVDRVNVGGAESGPAVGLPGQGRGGRREHVEHGRHRDHRHGRDRVDADLLRLRHVPGNAGDDGRRGRDEPDARRAAEHRAEERQQHAARSARASTSRTRTCSRTTCRPTWPRPSAARAARATAWTSTRTTGSSSAGRS